MLMPQRLWQQNNNNIIDVRHMAGPQGSPLRCRESTTSCKYPHFPCRWWEVPRCEPDCAGAVHGRTNHPLPHDVPAPARPKLCRPTTPTHHWRHQETSTRYVQQSQTIPWICHNVNYGMNFMDGCHRLTSVPTFPTFSYFLTQSPTFP